MPIRSNLVCTTNLHSFFLQCRCTERFYWGAYWPLVSDPDGAVVANVTVDITGERTGKVERSINSEADGSYSATLLPLGTYRLRVAAANFKQSLIAVLRKSK